MAVQFLINAKGEKTSVLVPYKEWLALNKEREELIQRLQEAEASLRVRHAVTDAEPATHPIKSFDL